MCLKSAIWRQTIYLIWNYARDNGLTIVSKDSDFHRMSFVLGAPPQVIWLRVGNCPTRRDRAQPFAKILLKI